MDNIVAITESRILTTLIMDNPHVSVFSVDDEVLEGNDKKWSDWLVCVCRETRQETVNMPNTQLDFWCWKHASFEFGSRCQKSAFVGKNHLVFKMKTSPIQSAYGRFEVMISFLTHGKCSASISRTCRCYLPNTWLLKATICFIRFFIDLIDSIILTWLDKLSTVVYWKYQSLPEKVVTQLKLVIWSLMLTILKGEYADQEKVVEIEDSFKERNETRSQKPLLYLQRLRYQVWVIKSTLIDMAYDQQIQILDMAMKENLWCGNCWFCLPLLACRGSPNLLMGLSHEHVRAAVFFFACLVASALISKQAQI